MGGAADKNLMLDLLNTARQNEKKHISIAWTNIYC